MREKLPWLAGSSCSLIVGTPLGQKYGHPDDLSGPYYWHVPTPAHILMHSQHAPPTPLVAPVLDLQVGQEGRSQDLGRTTASLPDLSPPLLPSPTCLGASTWA